MIQSNIRRLDDSTPEPIVAAWVIDDDRFNPFYHQFMAVLYHLRKVDGLPEANKAKSRMTHELVTFFTDPSTPVKGNAYPEPVPFVVPPEINIQFRAQNDKNAAYIIDNMMEVAKLNGLGPTREWTDHWVYVLSNATKFDVFKANLWPSPLT